MTILPNLPARLTLPAALALALAVPLAAVAAMPEPMAAMHCEHHPELPACGPAKTLPDTTNAPAASAPAVVELADGAFYVMRAAPVTKTINGTPLRLFAYNGSVPGPLLKVRQGTQVTIGFENAIDQPSTIHWHGLRVDYREDGTPGIGQPAIPPGSRAFYRLRFPDEGMYWYHPHVREDYQQDAGLYGNVWVLPADSAAYAPVAQEIPLLLDDILIENGAQVPWGRVHADYAIMGRYGNVRLVNGETAQQFTAKTGDRVRLYLTNAANVRNFRLKLPGQKLRVVGSDGGRTERETLVDTLLLGPSERAIVEIQFPRAGSFALYDDTPADRVKLASFEVSGDAPADAADPALRDNPLMSSDLERLQAAVAAEPKFQLTMDVRFGGPGGGAHAGHGTAAAPSTTPPAPAAPAAPSLPKPITLPDPHAGHGSPAPVPVDPADSHKQKLETAADAHAGHEHGSAPPPAAAAGATLAGSMIGNIVGSQPAAGPAETKPAPAPAAPAAPATPAPAPAADPHAGHGGGSGGGASSGGGGGHHHPPAPIEWEDGMPADNAASSSAEVHWLLRDGSGAENMDVRWRFTEGEPVKIRLVNPMSGAHPMQHPIHFHGQRFVVTAIDGKPVELRAWKDTVLVPGGSTIDIVLDPSNPGDWMAHCHIAEHLSTGMMIGFTVAPKAP